MNISHSLKKVLFKVAVLIAIMAGVSKANAQQWDWARDLPGSQGSPAVATDNQGNTYVCQWQGYSTNVGNYNLIQGTALIKYDQNGNVIWSKNIGPGANIVDYKHVATDKQGNVYILGCFGNGWNDSIRLGSITLYNTWLALNYNDYFLLKIDGSNGNYIWARCAVGDITGQTMTVDDSGNVILAGSFSSQIVTIQNDTLRNLGYSNGNLAPFIVKYDGNGNMKWCNCPKIKEGNSACGFDVCADAAGNVFMTSGFYDTSFVFGSDTLFNHQIGYHAYYLLKYSNNGNPLWGVSGNGGSYGFTASCDTSGNVIISGVFFVTPLVFTSGTFYPYGPQNLFFAKYDKNGHFMWANVATGRGQDQTFAAVTDAEGNNFFTGGYTSQYLSFGASYLTRTNNSIENTFLCEYDKNGNFVMVKSITGPREEAAMGMSLDRTSHSLLITGVYEDSVLVIGNDTLSNPHPGGLEVFLTKFGLPQVLSVNEIEYNKDFLLYPNPNNGEFTLQIKSEQVKTNNIVEIYNALGEKVYSKQLSTVNSQLSINAPAGIYFYRVITETGTLVGSGKFMIE